LTDEQVDDYIKAGKFNDSTIAFHRRAILSEIFELKPGESKAFSQVVFWDKNPYFTYSENEFFLDQKKPHYLELIVLCTRDAFQGQMSPEDFAKLRAIPNFATGVFVSNRVPIDFSP